MLTAESASNNTWKPYLTFDFVFFSLGDFEQFAKKGL